MSNYLAFANVTAALRDLLDAAAKQAVSAAQATLERPDTLKDEKNPRVSVFLYQVTPNAAWRNTDLPTRREDGTVAQRPRITYSTKSRMAARLAASPSTGSALPITTTER